MAVFTNTGIYDHPAVAYAPISGVSVPANAAPDSGDSNIVIPMRITTFTPPTRKPTVNIISTLPLVEEGSNTVWGGNAVGVGVTGLAKIIIEGQIDTPTSSSTHLPTAQETGKNQPLHYAEIISTALEGRALASGGIWVTQDPLWFRDPYGRKYSNPRVLEFSATFVEGVPGRHNFNMTLVV